jgi:hypothetical protein
MKYPCMVSTMKRSWTPYPKASASSITTVKLPDRRSLNRFQSKTQGINSFNLLARNRRAGSGPARLKALS